MSMGGKVHSSVPPPNFTAVNPMTGVPTTGPMPSRNTVIYDLTIHVNEGWMTRDAARVVPDLIRQAVAELKTKLMLVAAENAVTLSARIIDRNRVERPFDLTEPDLDVR